jgi:hypothetical protein
VYINGKVRPVETIPGMEVGGIKENDGEVNSSIIYCKNFCKCHNVSPVQQLKKKKEERKKLQREVLEHVLQFCPSHSARSGASRGWSRPDALGSRIRDVPPNTATQRAQDPGGQPASHK